ncbi:UPF0561 protein C2orf68 homolog isoform X2 [Liolophura sinensis]|uniref:UPF0561 protein C2orf68 homolog isoform X2 n=1 Tax=Liolophura sinensis TaxID=3198878 RepID=UPI00315921F3
MASQPKARLDMGHGFIKCIIKNQVERDNYDKEVKAKMNDKPKSVGQNRGKKPELKTYVPPPRSKIKQETESSVIFDLEYEDQKGKLHTISINRGDSVSHVARDFGLQIGMTEIHVKALAIKLHEEVDKRQNGRVS